MHSPDDTIFLRNIFHGNIGECHPLILPFLILTEEGIKFLREPFGISGDIFILQGFHQGDQCLSEIPDTEAQLCYQTHSLDKQFSCSFFLSR